VPAVADVFDHLRFAHANLNDLGVHGFIRCLQDLHIVAIAPADEDVWGVEEVVDGIALAHEFRVGADDGGIANQCLALVYRARGHRAADGDHRLVCGTQLSDLLTDSEDGPQIRRPGFGRRRPHTDEDYRTQILRSRLAHRSQPASCHRGAQQLAQSGFGNGGVAAIDGIHLGLVRLHADDPMTK
jgi:hypothetical protein